MYIENISMSYEVYKFIRRNISELRDMFPNTTFTLSSDRGNYDISINSKNNEEFHKASKGTMRMITKLTNEETRKRMKKKIEKEKRMRRNADKAARDIMKQMNEKTSPSTQKTNSNNKLGINDDLFDSIMRNNMFFGLTVDAPCP